MADNTQTLTLPVEFRTNRTWRLFIFVARLLELFGVEVSYATVCWAASRSLQFRVGDGPWRWVKLAPDKGEP